MAQQPHPGMATAQSGRQIPQGQEVTSEAPFAAGAGAAATGPESELWAGRTNWKHYLGRIVLWFTAMLVLGVGTWILPTRFSFIGGEVAWWVFTGILLLSGLIVFGGVLIPILGTKYRLTTQRLFISRGILSQTTDQTELIRVDDVSLFKTFFGRLLGVGTVTILTTDASDKEVKMEGIGEPEKVAELVRSRMRTLRGKSLYVVNL
jgi:uncharacterized membrane protein YdbT with pleckstrin-like domain